MKTGKRVFSLILLSLFLWTPVAEQAVCYFCGPSPETSSNAKEVSHIEDDCVLQDGFHREDPSAETESIHIHFCTLHSTFVALTQPILIQPVQIYALFQNSHTLFQSSVPHSLYHPPRSFSI